MDPLHQKLKALKPDEPDEEIAKDLVAIRQARPGIKDEEIMAQAEKLVQGGGKVQPLGVQSRPVDPGASAAPSSMAPEIPAEPMIEAPAATAPDLPEDDLNKPESFGHKAATVALQGLAGLGDAISGSYGGVKTDFLKQAQGAEASEIAKRTAVSEELRKRRGEKRDDRKLDIESAKSRMEAAVKGGKDKFDMERNLAKAFSDETKNYKDIRDSFNSIQSLASKPSQVGDIALMSAFMRAIDPGARVTESDQVRAEEAGNIPSQMVGLYNKMFGAEGSLATGIRNDFINQAKAILEARKQGVEATKALYDEMGTRYGLDNRNITGFIAPENPSPEGKAAASSGKVKVSNGTETLWVIPDDLAAAEKDGFKVIK